MTGLHKSYCLTPENRNRFGLMVWIPTWDDQNVHGSSNFRVKRQLGMKLRRIAHAVPLLR